LYIAHKRETDGEEQTLFNHLSGTANRAGDFAKAFNNEEFATIIGLLHDLGKYSSEFQNRIKNNGKRCDHSTAGARVIMQSKPWGKLAAYCIAGHHSGLQDCGSSTDVGGEGTLYGRLAKDYIIPCFDSYKEEINESQFILLNRPDLKPLCKCGFSISFFIRMLFSTLVDADYLDTEFFMKNNLVDRTINYDFDLFRKELYARINSFSGEGIINKKRAEILNWCIEKSMLDRGLFTLTVPTGGGKTLSSMAFAINHLLENNMDRIIYVIPYTSIIEQNAKVFKDIFGNESVLEHHSNFDFSDDEEKYDKQKLASENWDVPIVVTTNVQFFESLFANKSSKCRKLHNIANSVIIFDEAQMLPSEYLIPCIMAIAELVHNYNSTAVLCSATQPAISNKFPKEIEIKEICENTHELYKVFKRTKIINRGLICSNDLANEMNGLNQCLCIVNTRKHALELYKLLKGEGNFHLSTLMCPEHRREILAEIRDRLIKRLPCRVVSTRLIEAGVDVDFPIVYRMICGVDSIIQAAGRCNREGKLENELKEKILGHVHVFEPEEEYVKRQPPCFKQEIEITNQIIKQYEDISAPEAIYEYFNRLYNYKGEQGLDSKNIFKRFEAGAEKIKFDFDFETIANEFRIIEENTRPIIIPFNNKALELIEQLKYKKFYGNIIRSLQGYTVNVYDKEFEALSEVGKLESPNPHIYALANICDYDNNLGLKIEERLGIGIYL
jgi:CRISPR-associated endonuclease/helicase Cas3